MNELGCMKFIIFTFIILCDFNNVMCVTGTFNVVLTFACLYLYAAHRQKCNYPARIK